METERTHLPSPLPLGQHQAKNAPGMRSDGDPQPLSPPPRRCKQAVCAVDPISTLQYRPVPPGTVKASNIFTPSLPSPRSDDRPSWRVAVEGLQSV